MKFWAQQIRRTFIAHPKQRVFRSICQMLRGEARNASFASLERVYFIVVNQLVILSATIRPFAVLPEPAGLQVPSPSLGAS
jgi:hypothetical protein